jgi:signal transduction histidine kinase
MKYTHPDGQISVSSVQKNECVEITVADNGVGMSEDMLHKLFKVDKSVTTIGTANEKGSGLGLILCKDFVEKHHGSIWIDSEPGKGSAFTFSLPMQ